MIGRTLALYFAGRFTKMVLAMFFMAFALIAAITFVEFFTRALQGGQFDGPKLALVALFKVPSISEETIPFATLFGSIAAFVIANRRLEIVIARAAGVSAWQFLLPACFVGLLFGVVATTLYNPLAASLLGWSNFLSATVSKDTATDPTASSGPVWLRQSTGGQQAILGAAQSTGNGLKLFGVTALVFGDSNQFHERIDAERGEYAGTEWLLHNATVTSSTAVPQVVETYHLPTNLTASQVRETFESVDTISFWTLPSLIETARASGLSTNAYELRYNALLSRPILLVAMVLIAAIVSLRFSRSRDLGRMILTGVGIGFMLYVVTKFAHDLGSGGIVPPLVAAWLPASVAILMGVTVLLHLEDG